MFPHKLFLYNHHGQQPYEALLIFKKAPNAFRHWGKINLNFSMNVAFSGVTSHRIVQYLALTITHSTLNKQRVLQKLGQLRKTISSSMCLQDLQYFSFSKYNYSLF
jgi:hypothetical protein